MLITAVYVYSQKIFLLMDPINIIVGINLIATFGANVSGAKKGLKSQFTQVKEKPESYLQKLPLVISSLSLVVLIISLFQIGTLEYTKENELYRIIGAGFYIIFSWLQISSYKKLGENYSQEVVILKKHFLVKEGIYKYIRHPQYLSQIIVDLSAAVATLSFILIPFAIVNLPLLIMRGILEDKLHLKYFKDEFKDYKKKSGFFIPFVG